ncbi:MAG: VTT domain-containing protein [Treponema sp.]|jgi:membrane protein DedA with SNARE-associated domain|nr:VTT domain-containing protein [Treponema sp.]
MAGFFSFLSQYIEFFPLAALICLILAGLNIPVSEDLIIIAGALVSQADRSLLIPSLLAIYTGVIVSDFMVYFIGALVRKGTIKGKFAFRILSLKLVGRIRYALDKYGILTFIVCRFIPFGVRNTLFMTSGLFGLPLRRFALYDLIAVAISTNTLFFLVYVFGEEMKKPIGAVGIILFVLLVFGILALIIRLIVRWKTKPRPPGA